MTKKKLLAPLFIAASFLLIGCSADTIVSRPSWIKEDIINGDYKDNKMKDIYDAIKELGDTNANVLNKVMYKIAQNQLGHFEKWEDDKGEHLGLKEMATGNPTAEQIDQFVKDYPAYAVTDKENRCYDESAEDKFRKLTDEEKREVSLAKIKDQYDTIINRVCELMYNEVKDGSYTTDGVMKLFSEEEYVRHLRKELYHPKTPDGFVFDGKQVFTPKPIVNETTKKEVTWKEFVNCETAKSGYLHIMSGNDFTEIYYPKTEGEEGGYIGRKILPDIYRELLIENYVREQRYTNLGRAYARKVKMIKIAHTEQYDGKILSMLTYYAQEHITGREGTTSFEFATEGSLDELNNAMIGIADHSENISRYSPRDYLEKGDFEKITFPGTTNPIIWKTSVNAIGETPTGSAPAVATYVYKGTKLGDMVEKFMKGFDLIPTEIATAEPNFTVKPKFPLTAEAKTIYEEFTNSYAYPYTVGVELKERELFSNDLTQDGWFMKSGGLTDITDEFRNQLFNINTSLEIDNKEKMKVDSRGWGEYDTGDSIRYFKTSTNNMHAYIVDNSVTGEPWESVVLVDKERNFFIIQVDEAASLAKLSIDDDKSAYIRLKATSGDGAKVTDSNKEMNKIVHGITKSVASGDTYKKNAEQYYLMISNILFYDQSVYDYFKSQFPELFK